MSHDSKPNGDKKLKAKKREKELRKLQQGELVPWLQEWVKHKGPAGHHRSLRAVTPPARANAIHAPSPKRVSPARVPRPWRCLAPSDREKLAAVSARVFSTSRGWRVVIFDRSW